MSDKKQAKETAVAVKKKQELEQGAVQLRRLVDILRFALTHSETHSHQFYLVQVPYDGAPTVEAFQRLDALCSRLHAIRLAISETAGSPRPHYMFVFHGKRLGLLTGRLWQLSDGKKLYDIMGDMPAEAAEDGLVDLGVSDVTPEAIARVDAAAAAAAAAAEAAEDDDADEDESAQNTEEA